VPESSGALPKPAHAGRIQTAAESRLTASCAGRVGLRVAEFTKTLPMPSGTCRRARAAEAALAQVPQIPAVLCGDEPAASRIASSGWEENFPRQSCERIPRPAVEEDVRLAAPHDCPFAAEPVLKDNQPFFACMLVDETSG